MKTARIGRATVAAFAAVALFGACGDDDDDGVDDEIEDVGDTIGGAVDDITDDS